MEIIRKFFGRFLENFRKHFGNFLEIFWNTPETHRNVFGNYSETNRKVFGYMLDTRWKPGGYLVEVRDWSKEFPEHSFSRIFLLFLFRSLALQNSKNSKPKRQTQKIAENSRKIANKNRKKIAQKSRQTPTTRQNLTRTHQDLHLDSLMTHVHDQDLMKIE